ncbi:hypothetical protein HY968_00730, partial [Candidatus Kaiserbacteria bacterium]|nr:hypothetical protein [Candidatus Kaiserbacteria bacterium]
EIEQYINERQKEFAPPPKKDKKKGGSGNNGGSGGNQQQSVSVPLSNPDRLSLRAAIDAARPAPLASVKSPADILRQKFAARAATSAQGSPQPVSPKMGVSQNVRDNVGHEEGVEISNDVVERILRDEQ